MLDDEVRDNKKAQGLLGRENPERPNQNQDADNMHRHAQIVEPGHPADAVVIDESMRSEDEAVSNQ